jgi:hypothetical protein
MDTAQPSGNQEYSPLKTQDLPVIDLAVETAG